MTNKQLVEALLKLEPDAEVYINIRQSNLVYGRQVPIESTVERHGYESWVNSHYAGATIEVWLPTGAYIAKWPKD